MYKLCLFVDKNYEIIVQKKYTYTYIWLFLLLPEAQKQKSLDVFFCKSQLYLPLTAAVESYFILKRVVYTAGGIHSLFTESNRQKYYWQRLLLSNSICKMYIVFNV